MSNPYLDRVVSRMPVDVYARLRRHWSARGQLAVYRVGYWLERAGLVRLSAWYADVTDPLHQWFGQRQARFLGRWL